ncbi:hypothetical protein [Arthrobacter sp. VKM Ac-2550]|uniref:hypothetical protein n=1 Tax=Crystallibacter permensis TaxID=1938888 RepID=UPI002227B769|nr:hypothetical protein [Arthrobacter sp. VKM Ac-2550]
MATQKLSFPVRGVPAAYWLAGYPLPKCGLCRMVDAGVLPAVLKETGAEKNFEQLPWNPSDGVNKSLYCHGRMMD